MGLGCEPSSNIFRVITMGTKMKKGRKEKEDSVKVAGKGVAKKGSKPPGTKGSLPLQPRRGTRATSPSTISTRKNTT